MNSKFNEQPFSNNIDNILLSLYNNQSQNSIVNALNAALINNSLTWQPPSNNFSNYCQGNFQNNEYPKNIFNNSKILNSLHNLNQLINLYSVFNSTCNLDSLITSNLNDYKINQNDFTVNEGNLNLENNISKDLKSQSLSNINSCNEIENNLSEKKDDLLLNKKFEREEFVKRRVTKCPHTDQKHYAKVNFILFFRICAITVTTLKVDPRKLGSVPIQINSTMRWACAKIAISLSIVNNVRQEFPSQ